MGIIGHSLTMLATITQTRQTPRIIFGYRHPDRENPVQSAESTPPLLAHC